MPNLKKTILLITLTLLLTNCNEENSKRTQSSETVEEQTVAPIPRPSSEPEAVKEEVKEVSNIEPLSYHDVFKEPEPVKTRMEQIIEDQELVKLDKESKELMVKLDELIIEDDLKLLDEEDLNSPGLPSDSKLFKKIQMLESKLSKLEG